MSTTQFRLYFRRYAPFETFGIPSFKGDTRKAASTSLQATSRTSGVILFNQFGILNKVGSSSGSHLSFLDRQAMGSVSISAVRSTEAGPNLLSFTAQTAGSNPLISGSPDIDTKVELRVDWGSGKSMRVSGKVVGDDFPNLEVFIYCEQSGKSALLVDGRTERGARTGPFSLFGVGGYLCTFSTTIPLNDQGYFIYDKTVALINI